MIETVDTIEKDKCRKNPNITYITTTSRTILK